MNKETIQKIKIEERLSLAETHALDEALDAQEARGLSFAVRRAQAEEPSLAWRSALNERLAAEAARHAKPARKPWVLWGSVLAPVGAACILALVMVANRPSSPSLTGSPIASQTQATELERTIAMIHKDEETELASGVDLPEEDSVFDFSSLGSL